MIHIATVHFKSNRWIAMQRDFFRRHLRSPYRVYGWLNDVPEYPADAFHYVCTENVIEHAVKLNLLADMICFAAQDDDDIIIFIDGDAFPIGDVETLFEQNLKSRKLIAVQRLENNGDSQPHPCFCATTVGFWRSLKGDWKEGYQWQTQSGKWVTDVGGNLLKQVREKNVNWMPILRTGGAAAHPVLFSIYADLVYHHGGAFRDPVTRVDIVGMKPTVGDRLAALVPWRMQRVTLRRMRSRVGKRNTEISEQIFEQIKTDPGFFEKQIAKNAGRSQPVAA